MIPPSLHKKIREIEEVLRNRILYIGNEIPEYFTTDKRDKQLYFGYPQQLIDELNKIYSKAIDTAYSQGVKDAVKGIEDIVIDGGGVTFNLKVWNRVLDMVNKKLLIHTK